MWMAELLSQKLLQELILSVLVCGEAACCSSFLRGVPCQPTFLQLQQEPASAALLTAPLLLI